METNNFKSQSSSSKKKPVSQIIHYSIDYLFIFFYLHRRKFKIIWNEKIHQI